MYAECTRETALQCGFSFFKKKCLTPAKQWVRICLSNWAHLISHHMFVYYVSQDEMDILEKMYKDAKEKEDYERRIVE